MLDAPDWQRTVVFNSTPSDTVPGPDSPDWQMTAQVVPSIHKDAPDWQVLVVGPGGGSPCAPATVKVVQFTYGVSSDSVNVSVTLSAAPKLGNLLVIGFNQYTFYGPMNAPVGWALIAAGNGNNQAFYGRVVQPGDSTNWGPFSNAGGTSAGGPIAGLWEISNANVSPYGDDSFNFASTNLTVSAALNGISLANDLPLVMSINALASAFAGTYPGPTTLSRNDSGTIVTDADVTALGPFWFGYGVDFAFGHGSYVDPLSGADFTSTVAPYTGSGNNEAEIGVVLIHSA